MKDWLATFKTYHGTDWVLAALVSVALAVGLTWPVALYPDTLQWVILETTHGTTSGDIGGSVNHSPMESGPVSLCPTPRVERFISLIRFKCCCPTP